MTTIPHTLVGYLARNAEADPSRLALAYGTAGISYGELWQRVTQFATALREAGVEPGDRVMVAAPREPEFVYAYFACHLLHAVAVPYDPDVAPHKLQSMINFVEPRVILSTRANPTSAMSLAELAAAADLLERCPFVEPQPESTADILLTSGTTGKQKGVMLSHRGILAAPRNINEFIQNTADDREALALPLNHSFGLGRLRCQILAGGAAILASGFQFPKQLFELMTKWGVTGFSFVPAAWTVLTRLTGDKLAEFSSQLRYVEIGSSAMPRAEKERLARLLPHTRICMHYGLTEASRSAFIEFHEAGNRLDSIGRSSPNVEMEIVDDRGRGLPPHQIGRIRIRGDHVMQSYWKSGPDQRSSDRSVYSGDLGYRDQEGYFYLCGREDDVINIGGRKVYPAEIEEALLRHQQVGDAVCVAIRDPITGEAVRALLVARNNQNELPTAAALVEFLRARLEQYKVPVSFEWVSSIPRNAAGKVQRSQIAGVFGKPARIQTGVLADA